ncbi:MAG: zf-HC2 domain-containing protein, partial [Planctomycetota bacterium]
MILFSCKEAMQRASDALDADLTLAQRSALRGHLLICSACRRVRRQMAFLHTSLRNLNQRTHSRN